MNKVFLIGCLAIALVALIGAGVMVVSEAAPVNAGAAYAGVGEYSHQASLCNLGDPDCPPDNGCSTYPNC